MEPITGNPNEVIARCIQQVRTIIEDLRVKEFYIGRTNDMDKRKSEHGCNIIIPIYATDSSDHAIRVEDELIKLLYQHPKCNNYAIHGGGGTSEDYRNYVYIAVWL